MTPFSSIVIGNGSLLIQCSEILLSRGHTIKAVVTDSAEIADWATGKSLTVIAGGDGLAQRLAGIPFDWLLSIANLSLIPQPVLDMARQGGVNFHDGPLPRYAGLNAPVWAMINGEARHGITWHRIEAGVDTGNILEQRLFDLGDTETALTLNTKCYEAAIDSFPPLLEQLESGAADGQPQDINQRSQYLRADRPTAAAQLDFSKPAAELTAIVRALDHGNYWNPLAIAKVDLGADIALIGAAEIVSAPTASTAGKSGTVISATEDALEVATSDGILRLTGLRNFAGQPIQASDHVSVGDILPALTNKDAAALSQTMRDMAKGEEYWRDTLGRYQPSAIAIADPHKTTAAYKSFRPKLPTALKPDTMLGLIAVWLRSLTGEDKIGLACSAPEVANGQSAYCAEWLPMTLEIKPEAAFEDIATDALAALTTTQSKGSFARDLILRDPALSLPERPAIGLVFGSAKDPIEGSAICLMLSGDVLGIEYDTNRLSGEAITLIEARLHYFADVIAQDPKIVITNMPSMPAEERDLVLAASNPAKTEYDASLALHQHFEAQVVKTPEATALMFEDQNLTYQVLNRRANQLAHLLLARDIGPGSLVGLHMTRGLDLLIAALGILKAGAGYVPLDPAYPKDRLAHYIKDSALDMIVSRSDLAADMPQHQTNVLLIDQDADLAAALPNNPDSGVQPDDVAYMIYTSGSTGTPKGVMVAHRNVTNFFAGMDQHIAHDQGAVWLAVTSLSFDISVLELFWTLARGFKLVIGGDENRAGLSAGRIATTDRDMDFSLYFWGNDDGVGPKKYELLLEGAKFADSHGFSAIWTPERHFHAFGGPYPNPSVTGAAVAAVTQNLSVRAGSCVMPLHHTARVAEEWAVIDNLTNGRAGLAVAAGWQPDDFVLRPENTPPNNRKAMFDAIADLKRLWRGEAVEFPTKDGKGFKVVTQPRPVSKELPIWVTIAGNPATWKEAGEIGAHVLTHLLGQSIDEVADKIKIYHTALRENGFDPADHKVSLMLHTYVGRDREVVRETVRQPLKDYLTSAAGLIKQCAWAFPAFKKPKGVTNPFEIDLETLSADELEGILEFAFTRYFEDSGLFGTVEDCLGRVEQLKRIGVDEIACLIDYGIPVQSVLEGLYPLAEVLRRSGETGVVNHDDFSLAAQISRHNVSHLQCTPSMARMIAADDEARRSLAQIKHLIIGGEALPGSLLADLKSATTAEVLNMYGPTETTIWSSVEKAEMPEDIVNIGRPIANTKFYVLNAAQQPVPVGQTGELYIGGDGVTPGYWQREDLTKALFLPDPFDSKAGARMYRTGDLAQRRADGRFSFLGRVDNQVKLRGYRIELGEVEAALERLDGIRQAVVIAREDVKHDIRLVAYVLANAEISESDLKTDLAATLPEYMRPAHIVQLSDFPLTPNKKIDRTGLPSPSDMRVLHRAERFAAPENDVQQQIAAIWSRILGHAKVGARDNFFDLGGHSLLAVQAHREIREALGTTKINITDIFRFPVLADLAQHLEGLLGTAPTSEPQSGPKAAEAAATRAQDRAHAMAKRRQMRANRRAG